MTKNIDWENATIGVKHDGSMAIPIMINGRIFWRTKKTFFSDVAIKINNFWNLTISQKERGELSSKIYKAHKNGNTLIFEFVAPDNRIVLKYGEPKLIFLAERNITTGEYVNYSTVKSKTKNLDEFIKTIKKIDKIEGFVIYDKKNLYKIKTDWYCRRHKVMSSLSPKFIVNSTLDQKIDDVIAFVKQMKMDDLSKEIESERDKIIEEFITRYKFAVKCFDKIKHIKNRKIFAEKALSVEYKSFSPYLFKLYEGKSIDELIKNSLRKDLPKIIKNLGIGA